MRVSRNVQAQNEHGSPVPAPIPSKGTGRESRSRPRSPDRAVSAVRLQLADECDAMARHALGSGITVPAWVLDVVERSRPSGDGETNADVPSFQSADPYESGEWDVTSLVTGAPARLDELGRAHSALVRLVA